MPLVEEGCVGIIVPEEYGGAGMGLMHTAVLLGAVAHSAGAQNAASALHISIFGMGPVIHHGSEELKRRTLPPTATITRAVMTLTATIASWGDCDGRKKPART